MKAHLTPRIRRDTVSADHAWWFPERDPEDGTLFGVMESNINKLIPMPKMLSIERSSMTDEGLKLYQTYVRELAQAGPAGEDAVKEKWAVLQKGNPDVWALGEQIKQSGFVPVGFEVEFRAADTDSLKLPLTSGETMYLNGKIDRVDLKEEEERIYINIIDYKSGSMALDLTSAYYGLQIQLIFYMEAALETVKKQYPDQEVLPGGVLYYNIKDPVVEKTGEMSEEMVRERMLEQLQMNGLMYPAVNELPKKVRPVSQKQFQTLQAHVMGEAVRLGNEIVRGETAPLPYKKGQRTACDYCQFRTVILIQHIIIFAAKLLIFAPRVKETLYILIIQINPAPCNPVTHF